MTTKWREASKFLAGATFVGAFANAYLWATDASVPFFGGTFPRAAFGLRAVVGVLFFVVFLYVGYLKGRGTARA